MSRAFAHPSQYLNAWLKENPLSDQVHCILRYDNAQLMSYCGRIFRVEDASRPVLGARHCEVCDDRLRQRKESRTNRTISAEKRPYVPNKG